MKRNAIEALLKWKNDEERKPLFQTRYRKDGYITNMPLYLARRMKDLL